jgi:hypothetical protein
VTRASPELVVRSPQVRNECDERFIYTRATRLSSYVRQTEEDATALEFSDGWTTVRMRSIRQPELKGHSRTLAQAMLLKATVNGNSRAWL